MSFDEVARALYRDGKLIIDISRDSASEDDLIRWAREDLEEALLDLKLALIEERADEVASRFVEASNLINLIRKRLRSLGGNP